MRITVELIQKNAPKTDTYIRPTLYKGGEIITPRLDKTSNDICIWTAPLASMSISPKGCA